MPAAAENDAHRGTDVPGQPAGAAGHEPVVSPPEEPPATARKPPAQRSRWKVLARPFGEIAIVTAGILIAFALEAWWDNRATAAQELVHLRALASDQQQNIAALKKVLETEEEIMSSSLELLKLTRAERSGPAPPLTDLFNQLFSSARYEPVMGAYEALVNSGGLTLIRDESLRAALAEFVAKVRGRYTEEWSDESYFSFAREFAGRFLLLHAQDRNTQERERAFQEMLRTPRFQEHLAVRYYGERDMANKYRDLLQHAERVLDQLRTQIQESD